MRARPATIRETSICAAVLPGAVVALVALVGVDVAAKASISTDRLTRAAWVSVRSTSCSPGLVRSTTTKITWAVGALLFLLAVAQPADVAAFYGRVVGVRNAADAAGAARLRRRYSISYLTGGRYGP